MKTIRIILWMVIVILLGLLFWNPKEDKPLLADGLYENCYMLSLAENQMKVFVEGTTYILECPIEELTEKKDKIVDIQIKKDRVEKITWKEGLIEDRVDGVDLIEGYINFSMYGKKYLGTNGKLYIKTGDEVRILQKAGSLLNREKVSAYVYNGEIHAVIVDGAEDLSKIRVLLHGEIDDVFHEEVRVTATKEYAVAVDGITQKYPAGKEVSFSKDMGMGQVTCPEGKIKIWSSNSLESCEYRGDIFVYSYEEGFVIRNELKLEEYLYSVVSSEMPSTYPEEALKAQAVCARSYAMYQMQEAYYGQYGAHVDDTVNSQVYNQVAETESTIKAVNETTGQHLSYANAPICAYFYSTSCGTTSDVKDVWIGNGESPVYLTGAFQNLDKKSVDYSSENAFKEFITSKQEDCFEKKQPWFRWSGQVAYQDLSKHVEDHLESWIKRGPTYYQREITGDTLGTIKEIQVKSRSRGGVLKEICLIGENGSLKVTGEYQIRKVLCPKGTKITLQDGSTRECSMLPSGYCMFENGESVLFTGGGYGHGVGMSQNGAKELAGLGKTYEEILGFYFPETEILEVY